MKRAKRELLKKCRKSKGSQSLVASELGISTVYVRMIENGTYTPGRDLMFKFSNYFGEPVEELFPDFFDNLSLV
ncbi:hypothetical protein PAEVO_03490 [Paenibacillus sp. GM2FR]|uniref:helix-turn-helix transcriptional regulator n=1 Tax=Paenibacillus sp. GM2FR TaxID=2059268 RepID=UPI000C2806FF|nr:helix-turn-helix transcriptional regulator [Paenibacillus sp. GM2FR]PJN53629.1 hypothetical protein PAEVO_03490 [Paenibacillus sp. GM2FR]